MANGGFRRFGRVAGVWTALSLMLCSCGMQTPKVLPSTDIDESRYRDAVRILASDDFEGRKPGTPGEEKTVAYLTEQFRKLGLKPGNGPSYVQPVPLTELAPLQAELSVLGQSGTRRLESGKEVILWSKRSGAEQQLKRSDLVFVGYGIVAPEYSWNDYAGLEVRGKTLLVLVGDPGTGGKDPTLFKGNALSAYGRLQYKLEEAGRQGAAGVLLIHDAAVMGYGWSAVRSTWGGTQFAPGGAREPARAAIEGWIENDAARSLFAAAGQDFAALSASASQRGFQAVGLNCKVDGTLRQSVRQITSANVIALLPGHKIKNEFLIYTAHWDSLGVAPRDAHAVYTGAVDNASGVAGLLTLAQSLVRTQPVADRSIVFLATTASEPDFLGSTYYAQNPVFPLRLTAAFINVDTLLIGGHSRDISIFGFGNSDIEDSVRAEGLLQGRETHPDPFPQLGLYYRSDAYVFAHYGVPALYAVSGIDNAARGPNYGRAQRQDFLAHTDHQTTDQYSPDWQVRGALDDLALYYGVGNRVARGRRFPRWLPNSEFRAAHPRSEGAPADPGS
jgi:Zn-dependent M28 family amino/carboxypeptidase